MKTCFKRISEGVNVYFRRYDFDDGRWTVAEWAVPEEDDDIFFDSEGNSHRLSEICEIGISGTQITNLTVFIDDESKKNISVTDQEEANKIIDYINRHRCSK